MEVDGLTQASDKVQNRLKISFLFLVITCLLSLVTCVGTLEVDTGRLGYEFFPLQEGIRRVYEVEEVIYSLIDPKKETLNYQLMEEVESYFINQENDTTYVVNRYKRTSEEDEWKVDSVWTARRTPSQAIVTENNKPFVKLAFPVKENTSWDGNIFNTFKPRMYKMVAVNRSLTLNGMDFPETVTVIQSDNDDHIISTDLRKEIYAKNIGLVFKELKILNYCVQSECLGTGAIETGREYTLSLISHGKN